ncbi:GNAT family N-acetyltransferase [Paenibacillus tepidiphilus]|uniref:GNAT family N-acetyltransferase n=1 Tax=Paenibacillus tepidiphilus TaxID=2608683 RepID=UPI001238F5F2|nr:GNAT family N-acetyltransferase [Paenibacillus tepidiphilus]
MTIRCRAYTSQDLLQVRDYISYSYSKLNRPGSWLIARFEFEIFFYQLRAGLLPGWERNIGIWEEDDGQIAAMVLRDGDFYFQLHTEDPEESLLQEMFQFIENIGGQEEQRACKLAIPQHWTKVEAIAAGRGYAIVPGESDNAVSISLDREFPVEMQGGFRIAAGREVSDRAKALGHIMAFDYAGTERAEHMLRLYGGLREAPDYRSDLDLSVLNEAGEVVAFCNIFVDEVNRIGVLEPVGTHKDYRLQGLGKAVIYEGLNRLREKGARKAYVGPMQPFYERIGFRLETGFSVWRKELK